MVQILGMLDYIENNTNVQPIIHKIQMITLDKYCREVCHPISENLPKGRRIMNVQNYCTSARVSHAKAALCEMISSAVDWAQ